MRISLNNVWLTNDGMTDLNDWTDANEVQLNGKQIVQDAEFLRAVAAQPLARGNRVNRLQFTVTRQHASVAAASAYVLTAFSALPASGTATIICGALGETEASCTFNAVLEEMPSSTFQGTRTDTTFVLRGSQMTTPSLVILSAIDGASFTTLYSFAPGGTIDGGNLSDALVPASMDIDGGILA